MRVGTKSVLLGVHAIWIHPFFVAWGWWKLFGFPWDFRLWLAFFLHDAGYIFCPNMDGSEGEQHVVLGGRIMGLLFGPFVVNNKSRILWRFLLCGVQADNAAGERLRGLERHITDRGSETA